MILKPFPSVELSNPPKNDATEIELDLDSLVNEVMTGATGQSRDDFISALDENGASVSDVALALGSALQDPKTRIPAARLNLEARKFLDTKQGVTGPVIRINILSRTADPVNLLKLVRPKEAQIA